MSAAAAPASLPHDARALRAPYLLSLPALLLFLTIVIVPIAMTVLLSFNRWDRMQGILPVFVLTNWIEVLSDGYFREMFMRTFRVAALVTLLTVALGAPEAYVLNRMHTGAQSQSRQGGEPAYGV